MAESIWWQDGPFELYSHYDHVEVGTGWVVLITEEGYREIQHRYAALARYGAISRSLGQFGRIGKGNKVSKISTP